MTTTTDFPPCTNAMTEHTNHDDDSDSCCSSEIGFPTAVDFSGVNFDDVQCTNNDDNENATNSIEAIVVSWERNCVFSEYDTKDIDDYYNSKNDTVDSAKDKSTIGISVQRLQDLGRLLATGKYADILRSSEIAQEFFSTQNLESSSANPNNNNSIRDNIRHRLFNVLGNTDDGLLSIVRVIEIEILGIAALNLFIQSNYTGPSLHHKDDTTATEESKIVPGAILEGICPHPCISNCIVSPPDTKSIKTTSISLSSTRTMPTISEDSDTDESKETAVNETQAPTVNTTHNVILSELAVDGYWPCQVCYSPYFLLLARSILSTITDPTRRDWTYSIGPSDVTEAIEKNRDGLVNNQTIERVRSIISKLSGIYVWNARSIVAHERLLQTREPSMTLWKEIEVTFEKCLPLYCPPTDSVVSDRNLTTKAASVMLELGLAEHHFDKPGKGRSSFNKAVTYSGLDFEVTGAVGKRTKFQQKATAQILVKAKSKMYPSDLQQQTDTISEAKEEKQSDNPFQDQRIEHSEEEILLERIKFDDDKENDIQDLSILDQSILLALCLDVKNTNPIDGLTNEEMGAYLARVLDHHDDWMVYSTGLLERSWVEFERLHARERALLQIQALADQHTNRLTITQSTRKSIEESAPVQDRLKNIHIIVYPPRWCIIEDLADRYASMGIVTSAAELYLEIEAWDYVVECYKRAGRMGLAEKIVRQRLSVEETPRMWNALGDITNDPMCYEKAIELSHGRFANAYISLGAYYFGKGELEKSFDNYRLAVKVRPLVPSAWFRIGTISMQLGRWDDALQAFSEVVMQEPEDADAWANVAAVHMHNKKPAEAYPALIESLKHKRSNWRVWISKLYTCLDLNKYDEAIQACMVLLDLRNERKAKDGIPPLEEKCVRAIVGGVVQSNKDSQGDQAATDSARRSLSRVHALLDRISSSSDAAPWVFETMAYLHNQTGNYKELVEELMKEYRALQNISGWEKDDFLVRKVQQVVSQIIHIYEHDTSDGKQRENLTKGKFLVRGVIQKIETVRGQIDTSSMPEEYSILKKLQSEVEEKIKTL